MKEFHCPFFNAKFVALLRLDANNIAFWTNSQSPRPTCTCQGTSAPLPGQDPDVRGSDTEHRHVELLASLCNWKPQDRGEEFERGLLKSAFQLTGAAYVSNTNHSNCQVIQAPVELVSFLIPTKCESSCKSGVAPCDYWLFRSMKKITGGKHLLTIKLRL